MIRGALALQREVHELEVVAISAFQGVIGFQAFPFVAGQFQTFFEELFTR